MKPAPLPKLPESQSILRVQTLSIRSPTFLALFFSGPLWFSRFCSHLGALYCPDQKPPSFKQYDLYR